MTLFLSYLFNDLWTISKWNENNCFQSCDDDRVECVKDPIFEINKFFMYKFERWNSQSLQT